MDYSLLLGIHNLDKEPKGANSGQLEVFYEKQVKGFDNQQTIDNSKTLDCNSKQINFKIFK